MFQETDGLSPHSHLSQVHWEGEGKDSHRKSKVHRKRLDALLLPWANEFLKPHSCGSKWKGKKTTVILYLSRSCTFLGACMNKSSYFTLTTMKTGLRVFLMEKDIPANSLTSVISQTVILHLSAPVGLSGLSAAECSSLVLGRDRWIREDTHTRL